MIYKFRNLWAGSTMRVDPQAAGERLEKLRKQNGNILPTKAVVDDARPVKSPLHPAFEWDDTVAAEHYREQQARNLIGNIVAVVQDETKHAPEKTMRAFVNIRRDNSQAYTSIQYALSDDELRAQVVERAWSELELWRRRYDELKELARVFSVIDKERPKKAI